MKGYIHLRNRFCWALLFLLVICFMTSGCDLTNWRIVPPTEPADNWTETSHSDAAPPAYDVVFDESVVKRIDLVFKADDWQAMLDHMTELVGPFGQMAQPPSAEQETADTPEENKNTSGQIVDIPPEVFEACDGLNVQDACSFVAMGVAREGTCIQSPEMGNVLLCMSNQETEIIQADPIYKPCTVKFQDKAWQHVGMRFKGNSSLFLTWGGASYKLPFRLDFDRYENDFPETENQRFYGFDKLTFASGFLDNSLLREQLASDVFRAAGVPAANSAFYRVYIDHGEGPIYFGLYTMIEDPNGPLLSTQFNDGGGNLYKPEGDGATFAVYQQESFSKKTNKSEEDWSDTEAMYAALHADREDAAAWRNDLESVFNVNGFLQYLAVNNFVMNWDCYGRYPHNYYLYADSDILNWIPWDHNMAWMDVPSRSTGPEFPDLSHINEDWPLIRYILDDPVYFSRYLFFVNETLNGVFETKKMTDRFQSAFNLIKPHVVGPEGEKQGYTMLKNESDFNDSLQSLLDFAENRRTVSTQLLEEEAFSPSAIVINEIHYHPLSEQGNDYEFVELTNTGSQIMDLSGYTFAGIDFTFAENTTIVPGEYVIICKNADIYAGKAGQVFQYDGKLSNKGEPLFLLDTNEHIVDYVQFDDNGEWPQSADGEGFSLELVDSGLVNSMAENWKAVTMNGTPGQPNNASMTQ